MYYEQTVRERERERERVAMALPGTKGGALNSAKLKLSPHSFRSPSFGHGHQQIGACHVIGRLPTQGMRVQVRDGDVVSNRPISVYCFPRRALTLCPQLCTGIQPDARFPARSADALPATLYRHFVQATYRNLPIAKQMLLATSKEAFSLKEEGFTCVLTTW